MKKALVILAAVLVVVSMFTGCKKEPEIKSYTVTFDVNGGTGTIDPQTVVENEKAEAPAAPENYGYIFKGWVTSDGTAYDFATPVTGDISLKAEWKKIELGDTGPAGGIVFYIADETQTSKYVDASGNEVEYTWKYLEVAPAALPDAYLSAYYGPEGNYSTCGTVTDFGSGRMNTRKIVNAIGETSALGPYAAKVADDYSLGGYDDWFLPSIEELEKLDESGKMPSLDDVYLISSSEKSNMEMYILDKGTRVTAVRATFGYVLPIRAF